MANYGKGERAGQREPITGAPGEVADGSANDRAAVKPPISIKEWKSRGGAQHPRSPGQALARRPGNLEALSRREKQAAVLRAIFCEETTDEQLDAMLGIVAGLGSCERASDQVAAQDWSGHGGPVTDAD